MATRQERAQERADRELSRDINSAIANTEQEIFDEAMGDEEPINDGDRSLEEMGDGLEGQDSAEEEEAEETEEAEGEEEEAEGEEEAERGRPRTEAEQAEEEEGEEEPLAAEQQQDRRGFVPSNRLREQTERARAAEERSLALERELAEIRGRVQEVSARVNAAPQPQQTQPEPRPKPDMFADPEGYERWSQEQADARAEQKVQQAINALRAEQNAQFEARVNDALVQASVGERSFEFNAAYQALTSLDPRNQQHRAIVRGIVSSPDPGRAMFDWWDENGGQQWREQLAERLGFVEPQQPQRRMAPRHETRLPASLRRQPPSLSSVRGGQRHEIADPEMLDGSDESIWEFATRR